MARDLHCWHMLAGSLDANQYKLLEGLMQLGAERRHHISNSNSRSLLDLSNELLAH